MPINDRILQRLEALSISARAASMKAGLNPHFLQKHLADRRKSLSVENLLKLADALQTSPEWLLLGHGPGDLPPGASELLTIYAGLKGGDRKSVLDYARWVLTRDPSDT